MSSFKEREKAHENKFVLDEELKFKITSRRRKLLGLWVAEKLGLEGQEAQDYAADIIGYGIEDNTPGAVIKKIAGDAAAGGVHLTEEEIRAKNAELEVVATRQIQEDKK